MRFNEVITPEVIEADYEYRVDTDVITAVTVSGGQSDPDNSVTVTFSILGRSYKVENVYYPEDGQQLVWVKWHTPSTEQHITISVTASGGSASVSRGTITANIVDLDDNPPPNPVADDRNDGYRKENAVMPVNPEKTQAAWSVWKPSGRKNGYGTVTGTGSQRTIRQAVRQDAHRAMDTGRMMASMWMKAGGNLKRNIIRHP